MKPAIFLPLFLAASALTLAACGGDAPPDDPSSMLSQARSELECTRVSLTGSGPSAAEQSRGC